MLAVIAFVASCGLAVVGLGVLVAPSLPKLSAPPAESRNDTGTPNRSSSGWPELQISPARNRQVPEQALRAKRLAFFDENDVGSIASLKRHAAELDGIIPEWLSLSRSEFTGRPELHTGSETVVNADGSHRVRSAEVTSWLRQNAPHLEVYPQLTSNLTANETALVLAAPDSRSRLVEQLTEYLRQNSFQGVTVSLPDLPNSHRHVVVFLSELGNRLRAEGRKLIVEVSGFDLSHRMQALSQAADYVLLNLHKWYLAEAYDRTSRPGAGPLAGQGWFEDRLWAHVAKIGPGKLIIGIGSFGYDWDTHGVKRPLSVPAAWDLMERFGASLRFDGRSLNPTFNYVDRTGLGHEVWFLDGVTAIKDPRRKRRGISEESRVAVLA